MTEENIRGILFQALEMANHARDKSEQIPITPETVLYGSNGHLDSMGLVAFLIDVEESFQDEGIRISLSDDRAMSQNSSPFRNIPSLTEYITKLLGDA